MHSGGIHVGGVRGWSHSDSAGGATPRVRAAKSSEFGGGKVVSILDGPIWGKRSIALTCPARSHFQCTQSKERWGRVGMNITANQKKEENEETKKGKRKAGEMKKRKQATDFKEAVCCPAAVVQGAA